MFEELTKIKFDKHLKTKNGLKYLSWTLAWSEFVTRLKKLGVKEEDISYKVRRYKLGEIEVPYMYDENTGYMVTTEITVKNDTKEMWLPVMDSNNKAMKKEPYTYKVKEYKNYKWTGEYSEKVCEAATMTDINKAIMRCLVKNIAMFGLGLSIYNGEDLPEDGIDVTPKKIDKSMEDSLRELIKTKLVPDEKVLDILKEYKYKKLADIEVDKVVKIRNDLAKL